MSPRLTAVPTHPPVRAGIHAIAPPAFRCFASAQDAGTRWVRARGELDLAGTSRLNLVVREALSSARTVVLDIRRLAFIDGAGVHAVVDLSVEALFQDRRLIVAFASPRVARVFALTGATDVVELRCCVAGAPFDQPSPAARWSGPPC